MNRGQPDAGAQLGFIPYYLQNASAAPSPIIPAGQRLLGDVLRPQLRVGVLERAHHVHAPLIIQNHHVNAA